MLADDLTGALDTAAPFAGRGLRTRVLPWHGPGLAGVAAAARGCDVLVLDTASRHVPARSAAIRVGRGVRAARAAGVERFYKKIDSTLRGNVAAELDAFRRATAAALVPVVPAFPQLGRTVRGGHVYVDGQPLEQTPFADDPRSPIRTGRIADVLAGRRGFQVYDAETDEDLYRVALDIRRTHLGQATAGSAGFAHELARDIAPRRRAPEAPPPVPGPMLVLNGSRHPTAHAQVSALIAAGATGVRVPGCGTRARSGASRSEVESARTLLASHLAAGEDVVLSVPAAEDAAARRPVTEADALACAATAAQCIRGLTPGVLVVIGGDTAAAVVRDAGWHVLDVAGEVLPGVAAARPPAGAATRWLLTKAGGFGDAGTLVALRDRMRAPS